MVKSLEKLYHFCIFENVRYFESRYYAEKFVREYYAPTYRYDLSDFFYERVGDEFCIYTKLYI